MSAKEMFIDLNYKQTKNNERYLRYTDIENEDLYILFYKDYKVIGGNQTYDYFCDMNMLEAINKQVEELGWNNDN